MNQTVKEAGLPYEAPIGAKYGGDERIRTAGLPRAKRTLYQLSYTPLLLR
jgi:hypothetical protein